MLEAEAIAQFVGFFVEPLATGILQDVLVSQDPTAQNSSS
jgi:hypothetical protein